MNMYGIKLAKGMKSCIAQSQREERIASEAQMIVDHNAGIISGSCMFIMRAFAAI